MEESEKVLGLRVQFFLFFYLLIDLFILLFLYFYFFHSLEFTTDYRAQQIQGSHYSK